MTAVGLHSSLGGASQAAAAFRAGLSRARELADSLYADRELLHEHLLVGHPAAGLPDGFGGIGRLVKLASSALADLRNDWGDRRLATRRIELLVALPDDCAADTAKPDHKPAGSSFEKRLSEFGPAEFRALPIETICGGPLGVLTALERARTRLLAGQVDACIVGAVDSMLDPLRLLPLVRTGRVKTVDHPVGLMPGEAACFVLLETLESGDRRGRGLVLHRSSRGAADPTPASPKQPAGAEGTVGMQLAGVLLGAIEHVPDLASPGVLYSDLDGDPVKAAELAHAWLRLAESRNLGAWRHEVPAVSFGNVGCAAALLPLCLALATRRRGYVKTKDTLVVLTDPGNPAAFVASGTERG